MAASSTDSFAIAEELVKSAQSQDFNEADTRANVIDRLLHDVLGWPHNLHVKRELHIHEGYADYVLSVNDSAPYLVIEAKRVGIYFDTPKTLNSSLSKFTNIKSLLTDDQIKAAIEQVRDYAIEIGCEFACVTNGQCWIFFRCFAKGRSWRTLQAFVVHVAYFSEKFIEARNSFSYAAAKKEAPLGALLGSVYPQNREIYYPKSDVTSYDHEVQANKLAKYLKPIVQRYFSSLNPKDPDFMIGCYVDQRENRRNEEGLSSIFRDALSPFFEDYGVTDIEEDNKGGAFGKKLTRAIQRGKLPDVVVLFGGKGAGKSTFLQKLLVAEPPQYIQKHAKIIIVDLLKKPEDSSILYKEIWDQVLQQLDTENLMGADRDALLLLFKDRFDVASKQDLSGLAPSSEVYNLKLNELIASWKKDVTYCAKTLTNYWKSKHIGCIVVLDNTDQFGQSAQDFCFTSAQDLSKSLECMVVVSMREERFYASKIRGYLDAYQSASFHIAAPTPQKVFQKRIQYVLDLLNNKVYLDENNLLADKDRIEQVRTLLKIMHISFSDANSPLNSFITACAHGNVRLALDLFGEFLTSGYTNTDEMTAQMRWVVLVHQVMKPMMIPHRYYYDEAESYIPNVLQIRSKSHGSHFTAIRILKKLSQGADPKNPYYVSVSELRNYFAEKFGMGEDFALNTDVLLKHGLVEANNRLDEYKEDLDSIRITQYGLYFYKEMCNFFSYLELVCVDCGYFEEAVSGEMTASANRDLKLFFAKQKMNRVLLRLNRTDNFLEYLKREEEREIQNYALTADESGFSQRLFDTFNKERPKILESAKRNQ